MQPLIRQRARFVLVTLRFTSRVRINFSRFAAVTRNRLGFYRQRGSLQEGIYTHLVYFNARMRSAVISSAWPSSREFPAGQSEIYGTAIRVGDE